MASGVEGQRPLDARKANAKGAENINPKIAPKLTGTQTTAALGLHSRVGWSQETTRKTELRESRTEEKRRSQEIPPRTKPAMKKIRYAGAMDYEVQNCALAESSLWSPEYLAA
jgi:hypothetical protein